MEILPEQTDHRAGEAGQGRASPQHFINKIIDFYFQFSPGQPAATRIDIWLMLVLSQIHFLFSISNCTD